MMHWRQWLGGGLILAGVMMVSLPAPTPAASQIPSRPQVNVRSAEHIFDVAMGIEQTDSPSTGAGISNNKSRCDICAEITRHGRAIGLGARLGHPPDPGLIAVPGVFLHVEDVLLGVHGGLSEYRP